MDAAGEGEFVGNCSPIILKTMPESKDAKGVFDGLTTQVPFWHVDALIVMRKKKYAHRAVMCPPSPVATQPIAGLATDDGDFFSQKTAAEPHAH